MSVHVGYELTAGCTQTTPGAKALMAWYLGAYANRDNPRPANLGIFVCKRLGSGWSVHADGRAADLGTAPYSRPPWGWALAEKLRASSAELGVQCVIFDRRIWSGAHPHSGWRDYSGSNPHTGHLHVELTRHAAETLTSARVEALIGSGVRLAPKPVDWRKGIVNAMDVLDLAGVRSGNSRTWVRGAAVRRLQGLLLADGYGPDGLTGHSGRPDGVAGPATRAHLGVVQKKHRTGRSGSPNIPDYIAGPRTWGVLAGVG